VISVLGDVLRERQRLDEAEVLQRETLAFFEDQSGDGAGWTALSQLRLALVLMERGREEEALSLLSTAAPILQQELGSENRHARKALEAMQTLQS
jgi:predicted negative regulator of RcsB-dependent stress response